MKKLLLVGLSFILLIVGCDNSGINTTMRYLRFPEQRRLDDFPSLREYIEQRQNKPIIGTMGTNTMGTQYPNVNKLSRS